MFETTGTPGMDVFLFVGTAPGEVLLKPYGSCFIDFGSWWDWGTFCTIYCAFCWSVAHP